MLNKMLNNEMISLNSFLHRVCEPEVMNDEEEAIAYRGIDNKKPNRDFVSYVCNKMKYLDGLILDIGCGPGEIALMLAINFPDCPVLGIDLSPAMLKMARNLVEHFHQPVQNLNFVLADVKSSQLPQESASLIVSNSVVHHVHEPLLFFKEVKRLTHTESGICIRDLRRPNTQTELDELVQRYTLNDTPLQRKLFRDSLHASLNKEEVASFVEEAGLTNCSIHNEGELYWQLTRITRKVSKYEN